MKYVTTVSLLIIVLQSLMGCTTMNDNFDCPMKAGAMCKSLDQIDGMVNSGEIRDRTTSLSHLTTVAVQDFQSPDKRPMHYSTPPLRASETVQRVWIAPHEDTEHNYHQASVIYTVVRGGHWVGESAREQNTHAG